jgi:3-hydroxyisobutyrate dehydrogenase-like beta-hydroxyacid dehydrogenase
MAADKTPVTVIGLGLMGSALAGAFQKAGHELTVWNRSPGRADPFRSSARVAASVREAVEASDIIVVSLLNYKAGNDVLRTPEVEGAIAGRTIVQLTTGTPNDARDSRAWAIQHSATYLDGAISGYPRTIGTEGNEIFYSGDPAVFESRREVLAAFGGKATFCGGAVGAASAVDLAALEFSYARAAGLLHAAALCAAESFPLAVFFTTIGIPDRLLEFISRHDFSDGRTPITAAMAAATLKPPRTYQDSVDATLSVHTGAIDQIVRASREAGIDSAFPQALHDAYSKAIARGHGNHDIPSLYEAFSAEGAGR